MKVLALLFVLIFSIVAFSQAPIADPDVEIHVSVATNSVIDSWEVFWEERATDGGWLLVAGVQYNDLVQNIASSHVVLANDSTTIVVNHPTVSDGLWVRAGAFGFDVNGNVVTAIGVSGSYHKAERYETVVPSVLIINLDTQ